MPSSPDLRHLEARNVDGTDNHADDLGSAGNELYRHAPAYYVDGKGMPEDRGNARNISNIVIDQKQSVANSADAAVLFTFVGQFLDHDLDLVIDGEDDEIMVVVPEDDETFTPGDELVIKRSEVVAETGVVSPRGFANELTSFIDASNIYGSSDATAHVLRADGGTSAYLATGVNDLLPTLDQLEAAHGEDLSDLIFEPGIPGSYVAGDVRVNENVALTSMHTIWMREHNYQVDRLSAANPGWSQDELFNAAKIIVEAHWQSVVYNEFVPLLLGAQNIPDYEGYNPSTNPMIAQEFASAAFRLGHTLLASHVRRDNEDGSTSAAGDLTLAEAFFSPDEISSNGGIDDIVRGLAGNVAEEIDNQIVDDVRNLLFANIGQGFDLAVFNIVRGREHGVPALNGVRQAMGLDPFEDFSDLTSNAQVAGLLAQAYDSIDDVDLWVGGIAEDKVAGSQLGSTLHTIVLDQFMRLRDGDRFFYESRLKDFPDLLAEIKDTSFSDIILRNTDIDYMQDDALIYHERIGGSNGADTLNGTTGHDLILGFAGHDHLFGRAGDDDLYGGRGADDMFGGRGDDVMHGEAGRDTMYGGRGNDEMFGDAGADKMFGGRGADYLNGGDGRDSLYGGRGADVLNGGANNDTMEGGRGADVYVVEHGTGRDRIIDFETSKDKLDVSAFGFSDLDQVLENAKSRGGRITITLDKDAGDVVQILDTELQDLTEANFIFADDDPNAIAGGETAVVSLASDVEPPIA